MASFESFISFDLYDLSPKISSQTQIAIELIGVTVIWLDSQQILNSQIKIQLRLTIWCSIMSIQNFSLLILTVFSREGIYKIHLLEI